MKSRKLFFGRPDTPALFRRQFFNRFNIPFVIQRADVAKLDEVTLSIFIEPSKRQSLGPADVGSVSIDPAGTFGIQESAGSGGMSRAIFQKFSMGAADIFGFNLKNGQVINAAHAAATSADQSCGVDLGQLTGLGVDLLIQNPKAFQG